MGGGRPQRPIEHPSTTQGQVLLALPEPLAAPAGHHDGPGRHAADDTARENDRADPTTADVDGPGTNVSAVVDIELIRGTELFEALDDDALDRVAASAVSRDLRRGDVVFAEGAEPEHLYVVEDGRIAIASKSDDGRESVFALMERGELFGEMGLLDGLGRSAEARALEPSQILEIPYGPVREVFEAQPVLLWGVVALLAGRLRNMDAALADSVFLDVTGRTAKRLLELAGEEDEFVLPITQEELAGMVGASRERVNKAIASFVRLGWIDQSERRYQILDRDQITRRAR